ncbi:Sensor histidine kinase RcsC [Alphaproteobacteria bacterium SO-S41]|nr:Sensor histidine kinase RcsC [Alphaproteobacteria bacterium SO-S41]
MTPDTIARPRAAGLDDFADWIDPCRPGELCQDLYRRFSSDQDLLSVPVVENGRPLGLVHRSDFMMRLAHNFGRALYGKKAITSLMDRDPLTVDRTLALETVQATIAGSRPCALVKGFIITDGGRYVALGTALSLIRHSLARAEERAAELAAALNTARSADAAKSTFLATMSHELRTPLNAVIGFSELIAEQTLGELDAGYVDYARNIREGGEHLLSIVTSVLDYAKTERGEIDLRDETVDLGLAAAKAARTLAPQAARRNVELSVREAPRPSQVRADLRLTRQILFNLAGNAIKFTAPGGRVEITAGHLDDARPFLRVSDTGCGMTADEIAVAMQPFRQVDNGLDRRHEGTGLGLPLVKAFVEAHGGHLSMTSVPGRGTTAIVIFPVTRAVEDQDQARAA